jgi:hypothetical protein
MQNFLAITNKGREIPVKARSENSAWRKANEIAGAEWIVEIRYKV